MVTGIEAVGLALGIFPILVEGLKAFHDGVGTIKQMRSSQYEVILRRFYRDLSVQHWNFTNTCNIVFDGLITAEQEDNMLRNPGSPMWRAPELQAELEKRLCAGAVEPFLVTVSQLAEILEEMQNKLGLAQTQRVEMRDLLDPGTRIFRRRVQSILLIIGKDDCRALLGDINRMVQDLQALTSQTRGSERPIRARGKTLSREMAARYYDWIRFHAISLQDTLKKSLYINRSCVCLGPHSVQLQLAVRSISIAPRSRDERDALDLRFRVAISFDLATAETVPPAPEWRQLELEPVESDASRTSPKPFIRSDSATKTRDPSLSGFKSVVVTFESAKLAGKRKMRGFFNLVKSKQRPDSYPTRKPRVSSDWKSALSRGSSPSSSIDLRRRNVVASASNEVTQDFVGTQSSTRVAFKLESETVKPEIFAPEILDLCKLVSSLDGSVRISCCAGTLKKNTTSHRVWPTEPFVVNAPKIVTLEELLSRKSPFLRKVDRLILGVKLASAVVQLHDTEWLPEDWSKSDILFFWDSDPSKLVQSPFVRPVWAHDMPKRPCVKNATASPKATLSSLHNECLFSLGIVLLELWHGVPFEKLQNESEKVFCAKIEKICGSEMQSTGTFRTTTRLIGELFDDAGEFYSEAVRRCVKGLDSRHTNLEVSEFKNEVQEKVIDLLEDNLEYFLRKTLKDIFGESPPMTMQMD